VFFLCDIGKYILEEVGDRRFEMSLRKNNVVDRMEWQSSYVVELYAFIKDRIMRQ
jgi:hypothetical protein